MRIDRAQRVFDEFGIVPNYVVDYPIATQEEAFGPLKVYADAGRALIGAHLHPWVSPPHEEEVNGIGSGNLPRALQEKLRVLTERIADAFGARLTYPAGRYGFGPNTAKILDAWGTRWTSASRRRSTTAPTVGLTIPAIRATPSGSDARAPARAAGLRRLRRLAAGPAAHRSTAG